MATQRLTPEVGSRHEGLAVVALAGVPTGLNALLILDRMLALLTEGGLDGVTASWAVDLLYLHISAAGAEQNVYDTSDADEANHLAEADRRYAALPADRYPVITSLRTELLSGGHRAGWAMQVLINGIVNTPVGAAHRACGQATGG
ncbi:TetR/AcrR family transcriptional regulator C-terminal domain-containing protein [Pseudonocardia sp.]|uniref:TetR/AcrR family transcriptional regulator C-terminal domain-containing protein n=1 Tax=Pseudonocardia sp. TaxID=60912 RepID=UPI0031FD8E38